MRILPKYIRLTRLKQSLIGGIILYMIASNFVELTLRIVLGFMSFLLFLILLQIYLGEVVYNNVNTN